MLDSYKREYSLKSNYYMNEYYQKNNEDNNKISDKNSKYFKYKKYLKRKYIGNLLLIIPIGYCGILFYMYITKS